MHVQHMQRSFLKEIYGITTKSKKLPVIMFEVLKFSI